MDESQQQLNECFTEMERLENEKIGSKIQKEVTRENENFYKTKMQPNLKVLKKWLDDYRAAIEINKCRKKMYKGFGPIPETSSYEKYSYDKISIRRSLNTGKPIGYYNEPSEFMESYIDATYNMFNIINKRLDDIEKKLEMRKNEEK